MKKFVFSLKTIYEYKQTIERIQKTELSEAQEALRRLLAERKKLVDSFEKNKLELEEALEKNLNVTKALAEHDAHFRYLRETRKELEPRIQTAEEVKDRCETALIATMKEIKSYENLKQEQYQAYLKELQIEEEKNMSDLVSFNIVGREST